MPKRTNPKRNRRNVAPKTRKKKSNLGPRLDDLETYYTQAQIDSAYPILRNTSTNAITHWMYSEEDECQALIENLKQQCTHFNDIRFIQKVWNEFISDSKLFKARPALPKVPVLSSIEIGERIDNMEIAIFVLLFLWQDKESKEYAHYLREIIRLFAQNRSDIAQAQRASNYMAEINAVAFTTVQSRLETAFEKFLEPLQQAIGQAANNETLKAEGLECLKYEIQFISSYSTWLADTLECGTGAASKKLLEKIENLKQSKRYDELFHYPQELNDFIQQQIQPLLTQLNDMTSSIYHETVEGMILRLLMSELDAPTIPDEEDVKNEELEEPPASPIDIPGILNSLSTMDTSSSKNMEPLRADIKKMTRYALAKKHAILDRSETTTPEELLLVIKIFSALKLNINHLNRPVHHLINNNVDYIKKKLSEVRSSLIMDQYFIKVFEDLTENYYKGDGNKLSQILKNNHKHGLPWLCSLHYQLIEFLKNSAESYLQKESDERVKLVLFDMKFVHALFVETFLMDCPTELSFNVSAFITSMIGEYLKLLDTPANSMSKENLGLDPVQFALSTVQIFRKLLIEFDGEPFPEKEVVINYSNAFQGIIITFIFLIDNVSEEESKKACRDCLLVIKDSVLPKIHQMVEYHRLKDKTSSDLMYLMKNIEVLIYPEQEDLVSNELSKLDNRDDCSEPEPVSESEPTRAVEMAACKESPAQASSALDLSLQSNVEQTCLRIAELEEQLAAEKQKFQLSIINLERANRSNSNKSKLIKQLEAKNALNKSTIYDLKVQLTEKDKQLATTSSLESGLQDKLKISEEKAVTLQIQIERLNALLKDKIHQSEITEVEHQQAIEKLNFESDRAAQDLRDQIAQSQQQLQATENRATQAEDTSMRLERAMESISQDMTRLTLECHSLRQDLTTTQAQNSDLEQLLRQAKEEIYELSSNVEPSFEVELQPFVWQKDIPSACLKLFEQENKYRVNQRVPLPVNCRNTILGVQDFMKAIEAMGPYRAFIEGGCLRNLCAGLDWFNDIDLVVTMSADDFAQVSTIHGFEFEQNPNKPSLFRDKKRNIDVVCVSDFDLEKNANARDFTCNALYANSDLYILQVIEGSLQDIDNQVIRPIINPVDCFSQDPIRILRAIKQSSELSWKLEEPLIPLLKFHQIASNFQSVRFGIFSHHLHELVKSRANTADMFDFLLKCNMIQPMFFLDDASMEKLNQHDVMDFISKTLSRSMSTNQSDPDFIALMLLPKLLAKTPLCYSIVEDFLNHWPASDFMTPSKDALVRIISNNLSEYEYAYQAHIEEKNRPELNQASNLVLHQFNQSQSSSLNVDQSSQMRLQRATK